MGLLDGEEFDRWRSQAERTMATARLAVAGDSHGWACFLYEQAAQLAVKGLLHGVGEEAWGHDLPQLVARAAAALDQRWPGVAEVAEELSRHYIPARYPDAHPSGTPEDHYNALSSDLARGYAEWVLGAVDASWASLHEPGDEQP
ncbi:MAG TPA: HEPN domain-containing protein [Acidimicrobiales bacterium]|nr:HEPN domain-containing protein [Acidimicrobiales bacterium]